MEKITVELNESLVFNYVDDDVEITDIVIPQEKPRLDTSFDENQNPKAKETVELSQKEPNLIRKSPEKVSKIGQQVNGVGDFVAVEVNSFLEPVQVKTDDCDILETKRAKSSVEFNILNQIKKSTPPGVGEVGKTVKTNHLGSPKATNNLKIGSVTIKPVCSDLGSIQESELLKSKRGRPRVLKSKEITESHVIKVLSNNVTAAEQQDKVISNELNLNESKNERSKGSLISKFDQLKAIIESNCSTKNIEGLTTVKLNIFSKNLSNPQINEPKMANINKTTDFAQSKNMDTNKNSEENTELQKSNKSNIVPELEEQKTTDFLVAPKRKRGRPVGFSPKKKAVAVKPLTITLSKYKRDKAIRKSIKKSKASDLSKCKNLEIDRTENNVEDNTELLQFNKLTITDSSPKEQEINTFLEPLKRKRGRPVGFSPKKKGFAVKPLKIKFATHKTGKSIGLSSKKENFTLKSKNPKNIKNRVSKAIRVENGASQPLKRKVGRPKKIKVDLTQLQESNRTDMVAQELQTPVEKTETDVSTVNKTPLEVTSENSQENTEDIQPAKKKRGRPKGFSPKKIEVTLPSTTLGSSPIKNGKTNGELQTPVKKTETDVSTVNKTPLEVTSGNSQENTEEIQPAKKQRGRPKGFSPKKIEVTLPSSTLGSSPIKNGKTNGFSPKKTQTTLITQFFKASYENKNVKMNTLESKQLNDVCSDGKKSNDSTSNIVLETSTHLGSKVHNIEIQQTNDSKSLSAEKAVAKSLKNKVVTFSQTVQNLEAPKTQISKTGVFKLKKSSLTIKSDISDAKSCEFATEAKEAGTVSPILAIKTSKSEDSDVEVKILDEPELSKPRRGRPKKVGTPDVLQINNTKCKESEKTKKDLSLEINNSETEESEKPREDLSKLRNVEPSTSSSNHLVPSSKPSRQTRKASVEIIDVEMPDKKNKISSEPRAKQLYVFVKSKDLDVAEKAAIEAELKRREKESLEISNQDSVVEIIDLEAPKRKRGRVKSLSRKQARKVYALQNFKPKVIVARNTEIKKQEVIENSIKDPKPKRGRPKGFSPKKLGRFIPVDDVRPNLTVEGEAKVKDQSMVAELEVSKNLDNKLSSIVPTVEAKSKRGRPKGFSPKKLGRVIPVDDVRPNLTVESEVKVKDQSMVAELGVSKNLSFKKINLENKLSSTVPTVEAKSKRGRPKNINTINNAVTASGFDQKTIIIEDNKMEVKDQEDVLEVIDLVAPKRKRGRPAKGAVSKRAVSLPADIETKMLIIDLVRADLDPNLETKNINGFESVKKVNTFRKTESDLFKVPSIPPPKQRKSIGKETVISSTSKRHSSIQFTTPKKIKIVSPFMPRRPEDTNTNAGVQKNTVSTPKATNIVSPRVVEAESPTKKPLLCTVGTQTIDISDDEGDEPVEVKDSEGKMSVSCQADIGVQKGKETETKDPEAKVLVSSVKIFKLDGLIEKRSEERSVGPIDVESVPTRDVTKVSVSEEKEETSEEPIKIEDEIEGNLTQPRGDEPEQGVKYETVEQIHTEFKYESQSEAEQMLRRRRMGKFGGPMRGRRRGYSSLRGQTSIDNFVRIVDFNGKLQNMKCRNQIFKCDHCIYVGNCKANLARHSLVHRPADEIIWFQCTDCPYRSKYEHQLKSHFLVHMDPNKIEFFQCPHCEVKCSRKHNLTNHIRSIHADRKYSFQCAECEYTTFSKDRLVAHLKKHSKEVHACNLCKFVTKRREYLLSHFKMKHTHDIARPFPCDTCSYKGKTKRELDRHYDRMHNKDQLHVYQCNHCSFNSIYKKNLEFHLLHMHQNSEGFQKFVCGHCDKTFSYKNGLKVHIVRCHLKLTDDDWHKCLECKYKSKDVATLKRHIKRNHGAPRLHCQQCSFATNRQMSMDAHVKTHEFDNEDILKCPECPYRIIQMTSFLYHMKVIHGKPISSREAEQYYMQED